jgi:hypothetical protein
MERWRQIQGYRRYHVSNKGRVRRRLKTGYRVLKPLRDSNGYYQVCLHANGKSRRILIHALVAAAFLGPRPADAVEINHISGVKGDNSAANLEYVTPAENRRHAVAAGLCARGERNGATSLTDAEVARIKARLRAGWPQVALAAHRRVHKTLINRIARGECWGWLAAAEGEFDAFVIKARRTSDSRWCTVGCGDSLPAATTAMAEMTDKWHELQVLHHGRPLVTHAEHGYAGSSHGRDSGGFGWTLFG